VLVELGLVEQRYQAVLEVLNDGASVTEVAARFGVTRLYRRPSSLRRLRASMRLRAPSLLRALWT
jgi:transposase-like protein